MNETLELHPPASLALQAHLSDRKVYMRGVMLCVVATVLSGIMFPVMTSALEKLDPFTFTSLRYVIADICFVAFLLAKEGRSAFRLKGEPIALAWLVGSVGFCGFGSLVFLGQQLAGRDGALTASIMMATQPMMGLIVNALLRKIMPPLFSFLFVLMSFCGVALVVTKGDIGALISEPQHFAANGLIVGGALCWVIYTFSASAFKHWSPLRFTTMTALLGLTSIIGMNIAMFAWHLIPVPTSAAVISVIPHLLYMGPIAAFVAVLCWNMGNKILTPMNGVLFMDVLPLTTFVVSALSGLIPAAMQIVGASMTGAALILNNIYLRRRTQRAQQSS